MPHITRIAHIADLHIGSSPNRSAEYRKVFDLFVESIIASNVDIVVIAGDIFHKKTTFTGSDVADFKYLLAALPSTIQIIIIPGNHDTNLNDTHATDLISPVLGPNVAPNIKWSKTTETFMVDGLTFRHVSVFDNDPIAIDDNTSILLYHGFIAGAIFGKYTVGDKESRVTKVVGNSFRAVLAGDIHGMQIFGDKKSIAYPGSMIQQNIGESVDKGYLLWDFPINASVQPAPPTFYILPNDSAMIRLDFRGKTAAQIQDLLTSTPVPSNLLKVALVTDIENSTDQQKMIVDKFGRVDKINYTAERLTDGIVTEDEIENTLASLLVSAGLDIDITEEIVLGYKSRMSIDNRRWYIRSLEFDNMFKYGQGNFIDFTKLEGISGVIADNRAGKSSIIDILVYTLFNKFLRGDKNSVINFAYTKARSKLTFVVEPDVYVIEKTIDHLGHLKAVLTKNGINITSASIIDTYKTITALIGNVDQFCMTGLFYNDTHNIVTLSPAERMKLLPAIIGIVDEQILVDTKVKIKNLKQSLAGIPTGDPLAEDKSKSASAIHEAAIEDVSNAEQAFAVADEYSSFLYNDTELYTKAILSTEAELSRVAEELASIVPPNTTPLSATPCELSALERESLQAIIDNAPKTPPVIPSIPEPQGFKIENIADVSLTAALPLGEVNHCPPVNPEELIVLANRITILKSQLATSPTSPPERLIDLPVDKTATSLAKELLEVDKEIMTASANISAAESQLSSMESTTPVSPEDITHLQNILSEETQTLQNYEKRLAEANTYKDFEFLDPTSYPKAISHTDAELSSVADELASIRPPQIISISATPCELSAVEREALQTIIDDTPKTPPAVLSIPEPQGFKIENFDEVKTLAEEEVKTDIEEPVPCEIEGSLQRLHDVEQRIHNLRSQIENDPTSPPSDLRYPDRVTIVDPTATIARIEKQIAETGIKISIVEDAIASIVSPVLSTYQPELESEKLINARSRLQEIDVSLQASQIKILADKVNLNKIEHVKKVANRQATLQALDDQINNAKSRSLYKFGLTCDECTYNKTLLDKDLDDLQKQKDSILQTVIPSYDETEEKLLVELQRGLDKAVVDKSSTEILIKEIEDRTTEHNKSLAAYDKYTETIADKKRELESLRQILTKLTNEHADILIQLDCNRWYDALFRVDQLERYKRDRDNILNYMHYQAKKERNDLILEARRKISQHELHIAYIDQMDKYHISQELQKKYNRAVEAMAKITAADLYSDYKKTILIKGLIERQTVLKEQQNRRRKEYEELQKYTIIDVQSATNDVSAQRDKVESIRRDINDLEKRISEYNAAMISYNKTMVVIAAIDMKLKSLNQSLSALNIKRKDLLEQIECAKWYEAVDLDIEYMQALVDQSLLLKRLEEYNATKAAVEQNDLILEARRKVSQHVLYESYIEELNLYHSSQRSYKDYINAVEAKAKITAADTYSDYKKCIRVNDIKNTMNNLSRRLEQLRGELEKLSRALIYPIPCLQEAKVELMNAQNALGKATANKSTAETNVSIRKNWEQYGKPLDTQLRNLEKYKTCLTDGSLRLAIIKRMLDKIVLSINNNLVELTDFTVEYVVENDQIELFIMERRHKLPIELASGFQKFIISLMFRIAVTMNKCEFLIIDEGFGCLDETNMRAAIEFFNTIQHCYRFLFIISHVSEMHAALNTPLVIKKIDGNSFISNRAGDTAKDNNHNHTEIESGINAEPVHTKAESVSAGGKITCGCGSSFSSASKKAHEKTQRHVKWLNSQ